jgi:hypothetical protein
MLMLLVVEVIPVDPMLGLRTEAKVKAFAG